MKLILAVALCFAGTAIADEYVQGHMRRDGVYVPPHHRTAPNNTKMDNYSTQGNFNPYTGQQGTVNPYQPPSPGYVAPRIQPMAPLPTMQFPQQPVYPQYPQYPSR